MMAYIKKRRMLPRDGGFDIRRKDVHMRGGVVGWMHKRADRKYEARYRKRCYPRWPRVLGLIAVLPMLSCSTPPVDAKADIMAEVEADIAGMKAELKADLSSKVEQAGGRNINIQGNAIVGLVLAGGVMLIGTIKAFWWAWNRDPNRKRNP